VNAPLPAVVPAGRSDASCVRRHEGGIVQELVVMDRNEPVPHIRGANGLQESPELGHRVSRYASVPSLKRVCEFAPRRCRLQDRILERLAAVMHRKDGERSRHCRKGRHQFVVPAYGESPFLGECLESILSQGVRPGRSS
jgi:hypothetical protein